MCPFSPAPSPLFVPWPWQAPWNWLIVLGTLVFYGYLDVYQRRRRERTGVGRTVPTTLVITSVVLFLAIFLIFVVYLPSLDRLSTWFDSQFARFSQQNCSLAALFRVDAQVQSVQTVALWVTMGVGLLCQPVLRLVGWVASRIRQRAALSPHSTAG